MLKFHNINNRTSIFNILFQIANMLPDHEYTVNEQQLIIKFINLIQGRFGNGLNNSSKVGGSVLIQSRNIPLDVSPFGDEGCVDMNMSYISSNSIDLCSPDRIDIPIGWEAPAPPIQPILQPLRLYVPELEEIRISPVIARKGLTNVFNKFIVCHKTVWYTYNSDDSNSVY